MYEQDRRNADTASFTNESFGASQSRDELGMISALARHTTEQQLTPQRLLDQGGNLTPSQVLECDLHWILEHAGPAHPSDVRTGALGAAREILESVSEVVSKGRAPLFDPFDPPGTSYAPVISGKSQQNQRAGDALLSGFVPHLAAAEPEVAVAAAREIGKALQAMQSAGWYAPGADFEDRAGEALTDLIDRFRDERPDRIGGSYGSNLSACLETWEALTGKDRSEYSWVKMRQFL